MRAGALGAIGVLVMACVARSDAAECPTPDVGEALQTLPEADFPDLAPADPLWPVRTYLDAEAHHARGEQAQARRGFRALVDWDAGRDDQWGGSSLVPFALWRVLGYTPGAAVAGLAVLQSADDLSGTRFFRALGLNGPGREALLPALPDLESEIAGRMLTLSLALPGRSRLGRDFNTYLNLTMDTELDAAGERAMEALYGDSLRERERLDLFRARRLIALREFDDARLHLEYAHASDDLQISAAAGLLLAKHTRFDRPLAVNIDTLGEVIDISVEPEQLAEALLWRARYYGRAGRYEEFEQDLHMLLRRTRSTYYRAEALYRLANHERLSDVEAGLEAFKRLRDLGDDHHRVDSAHYLPAMTRLRRGTAADLSAAAALLAALNRKRPDGPYFLHSLFWRARIAEQQRNGEARALFADLAERDPFGYFGLRARMHLAQGASAAHALLPGPELRAEIAAAYVLPDAPPELRSGAYHRRLAAALDCGLYRQALAAEAQLQASWPGRRLETLTVPTLEDAGLLPGLALLLALRQDALAAADDGSDPEDALDIAANVGLGAGEWNLAMFLAQDSSVAQEVKTLRQHLPNYLAMAYPPIPIIERIATAAVRHGIPPAYLYALMRNESRFLPAVISPEGAVGLVQLLPSTLESLGDKGVCGVPEIPRKQDQIRYLTDAARAVPLGACWLRRELLDNLGDDLQGTAIAHNAGIKRLRDWRLDWDKAGIAEDLELTLELVPYGSTRAFTRRVLRDYIVVEAVGLVKAPDP